MKKTVAILAVISVLFGLVGVASAENGTIQPFSAKKVRLLENGTIQPFESGTQLPW